MFFVWRSNGGSPLQRVGLAIFVLQFVAAGLGYNCNNSLLGASLMITLLLVLLASRLWNELRYFRAFWQRVRHTLDVPVPPHHVPFMNAAATVTGIIAAYYVVSKKDYSGLYTLVKVVLFGILFYLEVQMHQNENIGFNNNNTRQRRQPPSGSTNKFLTDIVQIMSKLPIDEYTPNEEFDKCTISQLKTKLRIRKGELTTKRRSLPPEYLFFVDFEYLFSSNCELKLCILFNESTFSHTKSAQLIT